MDDEHNKTQLIIRWTFINDSDALSRLLLTYRVSRESGISPKTSQALSEPGELKQGIWGITLIYYSIDYTK